MLFIRKTIVCKIQFICTYFKILKYPLKNILDKLAENIFAGKKKLTEMEKHLIFRFFPIFSLKTQEN